MKYPKLILAGALAIIVSAIPTQAAVYGTLRQDVSFNTEDGKTISRLSGEAITILEEQEDEYLIKVSEDLTELVNKNFVKLSGVISTTKRDTKVREAADPNSSLIASLEQD